MLRSTQKNHEKSTNAREQSISIYIVEEVAVHCCRCYVGHVEALARVVELGALGVL